MFQIIIDIKLFQNDSAHFELITTGNFKNTN